MDETENKISGGAIIFARQTIESDIFANKPDSWFKIWFFLIAKANHADSEKFKRGQCFLKYSWIEEATGATHDQIKHCIEYLKHATMIATQKSTRGFVITLAKYDYFQTLDNYQYATKATPKGTGKPHESHTINKNDKNDKKGDVAANAAPMSLSDYVERMRSSPKRYIRLIGEFADEKKLNYTTSAQWHTFTKRNLRTAKLLEPFTDKQIADAISSMYFERNRMQKEGRGYKWGMETLLKYIEK